MLHVLLGGAAEDTKLILETAKKSKPLRWIVPKKARVGDRTLFHLPGHGFVARGVVGSSPQTNGAGRYIAIVRDITLLPAFVPLAFIRENHQKWKWPTYPRSYATIGGPVETRLEELLDGYQMGLADSTALPMATRLVEGAATSLLVTTYERNPLARQQCIKKFGSSCYACGFSFGKTYGETADGYIHVHHLKSVSSRRGEYVIDPIKDLRPICPNCHAVIHLRTPPLSIQDLKKMLEKALKGIS